MPVPVPLPVPKKTIYIMENFDLRLWPHFEQAGGNLAIPALINHVAIDSRQVGAKESLFVALPGKTTDGHHFVLDAVARGAKFILVRHGYVLDGNLSGTTLLFVEDPKLALQQIASTYRRQLPTKIIAITGSYGKTMVKDLLQDLLKNHFQTGASPESYNSQIGVPLSLFNLSSTCEIAVIEAAISEKNEMDRLAHMLIPDFGIITPIGNKHIDQLDTLHTLMEESLKLYQHADPKWILCPAEFKPYITELKGQIHFWNKPETGFPHAVKTSERFDLQLPYQINFPDGLKFNGVIRSGYYYYLNLINMAVKAAYSLGIPSHTIAETLSRYVLEPSRKEIWKSPQGVTFINDNYAETPLSIDRALKFMKSNGDRGHQIFAFEGLKGSINPEDYKQVGTILNEYHLDFILLIGSYPFDPLIGEIKSAQTSIVKLDSTKEALDFLKVILHPGDTVLMKGSKKKPIENLIKGFHEAVSINLCQVNLAAIEHNIKILKKHLPLNTRIMVMVKAFAYGTDTLRIAKFLKGCGIEILGVSYVEEGVILKQAGITESVFVLNGADYEIDLVVKWDLEIGVSRESTIRLLAEEAKKKNKIIKVHLHVDTGMCRFGCRKEEAVFLAKLISSEPSLSFEGIFTHFASADDPSEDSFTHSQAEAFKHVVAALQNEGIDPPWKHVSNSAATLRFSFPDFNMVRLGLAVYGLQPTHPAKNHLKMAISLISRIAGINHCKRGETISYGRSYCVEEEEKQIAVLPIGYFDGLHRNYSGKGNVLIRGKKAPMIGKICMDFMMVDVTDIPDVSVGDPVLIFGEDEYGHYLSPEELAIQGNSISHELITCLGPRIQRFFIYEEKKDASHA